MCFSKKILLWGLYVLLLLGILLPTVIPTQATVVEDALVESNTAPAVSWPESNVLYEAYLEQLFYPVDSISFLGDTAKSQLGTKGQNLYEFLKANLLTVSSGASSSTVFSLSAEQIAAWGGVINYEAPTEPDLAAALAAFKEEFEVENVIAALLHDCPYELYWYDKVTGVTEIGRFSLSGTICSISSVDFKFAVVADMQAENYSSTAPAFDTSAVAAATTAANHAQELVNKYADEADYQKIFAYQKEICALVSYNDTAAYTGNFSVDADPWQLVYVFDGNPATNVVCEGYAKAFQYLYDLSEFESDIGCITVSGSISGEGHMWNIVTINGQNYLTDVTNIDASIAGNNSGFFLAGASGSISSGYLFKNLTYSYDSNTLTLWGVSEGSRLLIAANAYAGCELGHTEVTDVQVDATCTKSGLTEGTHCAVCGQVLTAQQIIPVTEHVYNTQKIAPTCTQEGYTNYVCKICGDQYTGQPTAALGHCWVDATCMAPKSCSVCGSTEGNVIAHAYVDGICTHCGYKNYMPMYRIYNPYTHEHLLTSNTDELQQLLTLGWSLDGIAWNAPLSGLPVYRLYNPYDDWHTYTLSQEEIDLLVPLGWKVDGVICYSSSEATATPIYRLFNPYEQKNYHLLTADTAERDLLEKAGWIVEGVAWQALT